MVYNGLGFECNELETCVKSCDTQYARLTHTIHFSFTIVDPHKGTKVIKGKKEKRTGRMTSRQWSRDRDVTVFTFSTHPRVRCYLDPDSVLTQISDL